MPLSELKGGASVDPVVETAIEIVGFVLSKHSGKEAFALLVSTWAAQLQILSSS